MSQNSDWECNMAIGNTNFEVSDPGFYDILISDQIKKTIEGEYALDEYGDYLENLFELSWIYIGRKFLQKLKIVTNDYRNSIVHHAHMDYQQCLKLRGLIFFKRDSFEFSTFIIRPNIIIVLK